MTPILILAAGESSRLGHPKQLVEFQGETLLHRAARTALAAGSGPVFVILGAAANTCQSAIYDLPVEILINANYRQGLSSSIRTGIQRIAQLPADSALIMLADQPLITPIHLQALIAALVDPFQAAATQYDDLGVPAVFHRLLFPQLLTLTGDHGAKRVLQQRRHLVTAIPLPQAALDIDTPADAAKLNSDSPMNSVSPATQ